MKIPNLVNLEDFGEIRASGGRRYKELLLSARKRNEQ